MAKHAPPKDDTIRIACSHSLSAKNFLIWRVIIAVYFWIVLIWSQIEYNIYGEYLFKTLIYLTIWTLIICTVYMTLSLYVSYIHYKHIFQAAETEQQSHDADNTVTPDGSKHTTKCTRYCKYTERMQIFATTMSLTVVISFWSLLWQYADFNDPLGVQVHGTTMVFTVTDFYLSYSLMSFKSTWLYVVVFGVVYTLWSILYQFVTDEAIYPVLDWKGNPVASLVVTVIVCVVSLLIHLFLCWSNGKLVSRMHVDHSTLIALSEHIHDVECSKDQTLDDYQKASLPSYQSTTQHERTEREMEYNGAEQMVRVTTTTQ